MERDPVRGDKPQDENDKRQMLLRLITNLRCVECGRLYDAEDFALVHRREDTWVLSTRCRNCNELCQVVVLLQPELESEPLTDLTPEEVQLVTGRSPISSDEVLDVHDFLQHFDGDFEILFAC